jgi:hypothetical protein
MNVLRHDYVADQAELKSSARFAKNSNEAIASSRGSEQRTPPYTTEGDEVEIALAVTALEWVSLEHDENPHP